MPGRPPCGGAAEGALFRDDTARPDRAVVHLVERRSVRRHLLDVADVAQEVFTQPPWGESVAAARQVAARLLADSTRPGFVLAVAVRGDEPCGFAYGLRCSRLAALARRAPAHDFTLRDLGVLPEARGQGLGAALHDAVLSAAAPGTRWLSTHPAAVEALGLYRAKGWRCAALSGVRVIMTRPDGR
ncbi:hypothetical protein GCM10009677_00440 [Sphaerisporangium rubeum]